MNIEFPYRVTDFQTGLVLALAELSYKMLYKLYMLIWSTAFRTLHVVDYEKRIEIAYRLKF